MAPWPAQTNDDINMGWLACHSRFDGRGVGPGRWAHRRTCVSAASGRLSEVESRSLWISSTSVALGDPEGITFIPAELAEKVADDTELVHLVDEWGHAMLRQGRDRIVQVHALLLPGGLDLPEVLLLSHRA